MTRSTETTDLGAEDIHRYFIKAKCPAEWRRPELCKTLADVINQLRRVSAALPEIVESGPLNASKRARSAALALRSDLPELITHSMWQAQNVPLIMILGADETNAWKKRRAQHAHNCLLLGEALDRAFPPGEPPPSAKLIVDWHLYAFMIHRVLVGPDAVNKTPWKGGPAAKFISFALESAGFGKITAAAVERAFLKSHERRS